MFYVILPLIENMLYSFSSRYFLVADVALIGFTLLCSVFNETKICAMLYNIQMNVIFDDIRFCHDNWLNNMLKSQTRFVDSYFVFMNGPIRRLIYALN